ncbi:40S ribosomal protein S5-1 [Hordeum vulgare]|nr:40S ribosomal protein S5-1 [Hordeum vulgare]
MLHIRDVEGPKNTRSVERRLEAMEHQVFKCQGMLERGLNANHTMITEFTSNHKMDAIDIGKHLSRLYDRVDQLQGQIYDLQNQNCEYEYRFKSISFSSSPRSASFGKRPKVRSIPGFMCTNLVSTFKRAPRHNLLDSFARRAASPAWICFKASVTLLKNRVNLVLGDTSGPEG